MPLTNSEIINTFSGYTKQEVEQLVDFAFNLGLNNLPTSEYQRWKKEELE